MLKSVRMELCFSELLNFDRRGEFLGRHPFIKERNERDRVSELLRTNPDSYFDERKNIELNITRYSSIAKSGKSTKEQKEKALENLRRHEASLQMYREIFNDFVNNERKQTHNPAEL